MDNRHLIEYLQKFPTCAACFCLYVEWLESNTLLSPEDNDLIVALQHEDFEKLNILEALLNQSIKILGLTKKEFISTFSFDKDLLTLDHEIFHDILSEPILVVNLHDHGFSKIKKLPKTIQQRDGQVNSANFIAERGGHKYAIELKTARLENYLKTETRNLAESSLLPYWWGRILRNKLVTKIEHQNQRVVQQLLNTKEQLSCDFTMLAFYTRRVGPAKLMETEDYVKEIADVKNRYKHIDYVFFKDYFGQVTVIPEEAPQVFSRKFKG